MIDHNRLHALSSKLHIEGVFIKVLLVGVARYDIQDGTQCLVQLGVGFSCVFMAVYLENAIHV